MEGGKLVKKYFKIKLILCIILSLVLTTIPFGFAYAENSFDVDSKAAILIDAVSGTIIYEKNPHEKLYPASITKIMTLLLTMEALESNRITLQDEVVVSENAEGMGGSQVYLEAGEVNNLENLLKAIALRSGNDAAVAIGEHIAGTEEMFIKMMNDKAKELGMLNTNFVNTNGLHDQNHYTTAYDISLMSKELLKHPKVHDWLTLWMATIMVGKNHDIEQSLNNTNKLIRFYQGANGIKTGYTTKSGHCLAASATRGNLTLISVVLGCDTGDIRFKESKKLLDYGFANYDSLPICKKEDIIKHVSVSKGKINNVDVITEADLNILIKKGSSKNIEREIILPEFIESPLIMNQKVGEMVIKIEGAEVGRVNLIINRYIEKANFIDMFSKIFNRLLGN